MAFELILQCHAGTRMMRQGGFASEAEPIDAGGIAKLAALGPPARDIPYIVGPALAPRQTAEALGVVATVDPALRDMDHGSWAGRTLIDMMAVDPDGLATWVADPAAGAPGGEPLASVRARMADWLAAQIMHDRPLWAITHPMVIRAALSAAIDMPLEASLRIDIAPLGIVRLGWNRQWRLQALGCG
ncbi:histidine phosphatase family protein [Sphingobium sp. AN558]|uniref:histidine phosphatase family protein n=1 Tax=Sphingobium sp. AN558 TaxID=3133442 RepID=UPI0030BAE5C3